MFEPKYIVFDIYGEETMIIFPALSKHSDIASLIKRPVVSAGFLIVDVTKNINDYYEPTVTAYGESLSLQVQSRPKTDSKLAFEALKLDKYR